MWPCVHKVYLVVELGLGRNSCINRYPSTRLVDNVIQLVLSQGQTCVPAVPYTSGFIFRFALFLNLLFKYCNLTEQFYNRWCLGLRSLVVNILIKLASIKFNFIPFKTLAYCHRPSISFFSKLAYCYCPKFHENWYKFHSRSWGSSFPGLCTQGPSLNPH